MKNPFYALKNKLLSLGLERQPAQPIEYATMEDLMEAVESLTPKEGEKPNQAEDHFFDSLKNNATDDKEKIISALKMGYLNDFSKSFANVAFTRAVNAVMEKSGIMQENMSKIETSIAEIQKEAFASFFKDTQISQNVYQCQLNPNYFLNLFYEKFKELQMPELDDLLKETVSVQCEIAFVLFADNSILTKIKIEDEVFLSKLKNIMVNNFERMNEFIQNNSQRVKDYYAKSQVGHDADAKAEVQRVSAFYRMAFATVFRSVEHNQFVNIDDTKIYCNLVKLEEGEMLDLLLTLKNPNSYPLITA